MAKSVRIAAVGDIHVGEHSLGKYRNLFIEASQDADILLLCGDLTIRGYPSEAKILVEDASHCKIPILAVLGNHDCEEKNEAKITAILEAGNIRVLNGTTYELQGIGFAGVKGFCGGFDKYVLSSWGEMAIKDFVLECVNEALKLEKAMELLTTKHKVIIMHYAPVRQTVAGEPPEIFPFLGCSRLEEPVNRSGASVVFHGHAHHGTLEGKTSLDIPVYNVSLPLLQERQWKTPYYIYEIATE